MMTRMNGLLCSAAAIALLAPYTSHAQENADGQEPAATAQDNRPVIFVTARKREETLIEVPLSITALGAEEITAAGIEDVADVALQTPGFSFRQGFGRTGGGDGGASVRPAIRGMSNILGAPNAGFFVDGIFVSGNITSYQLDNLERVEVIRGPQAALFGRQTFAGAVNFVTRKPTDETRIGLNATLAQYDHYEASGYVSGGITDDLFAEVNGRYYSFGGDYVNADNGKRDINAQQSWNLGGRLRYQPTDVFELIAGFAYGEDQDKGYATYKLGSDNLNCNLPVVTGAFFGIPLNENRSRGYFCGEIEQPDTFAYNNDEIEQLGFHGLERQYWRADLTMNVGFGEGWELTSITAFNGSKNVNGFDNDLFARDEPSLSIGGSSTRDFSQNVRVLSPQDAPIRGLIGVYYFEQNDGRGFNVNTDWDSDQLGQLDRFDSDDGVRNWAAYGMLEADVTDQLTLTAEARYQQDKIFASIEDDGGNTDVTLPTGQRSVKFNAFLPRFTARYEFTPDLNLYASVAKGNKPGGFNDLPSNIVQSFLDDFLADGIDTFEEEEVWSYELGLKGELGASNVYFNLAGFYLDWSSQQLTQSQPYQQASNGAFTTVPFIVNAGASEIKGFEVELFGSPTDFFDFRVGYSYNDATFREFYDENTEELLDTDGEPSFLDAERTQLNPDDVDGPNGQVAGNRLPQTPKHQLNLSGTFTFPMGSGGTEFFVRNDLMYESTRFAQVHNLAETGDSWNWNIRAGVDISDSLRITGFVDNVLEDKTPLVITRLFDFNRGLLVPDPVRSFIFLPNRRFTFYRDFIVGAPRKRQFGVTVNYRY